METVRQKAGGPDLQLSDGVCTLCLLNTRPPMGHRWKLVVEQRAGLISSAEIPPKSTWWTILTGGAAAMTRTGWLAPHLVAPSGCLFRVPTSGRFPGQLRGFWLAPSGRCQAFVALRSIGWERLRAYCHVEALTGRLRLNLTVRTRTKSHRRSGGLSWYLRINPPPVPCSALRHSKPRTTATSRSCSPSGFLSTSTTPSASS